MTLTIELPDEKFEALQRMAAIDNVTVEQLIVAAIDRMLKIRAAGEYVLKKNAELYRRLAPNDVSDPEFQVLKMETFLEHAETLRRLAK